MYKKIIFICGMPRSGTSWLGQIFDSSPNVAFRMEPLFAYPFKNIINENSSKEQIVKFFHDVYMTDDDFILQKENRNKGSYRLFKKDDNPEILVVKTTRHHDLIERYLKLIDNIEVVSLIRHPCAVMSSWIHTDNEFKEKGCSEQKDWRSGSCRKDGVGEFWGFDDWVSITKQHLQFNNQYKNFTIIKYKDLIKDPICLTTKLFKQFSLQLTDQTLLFLNDCNVRHDIDPYSVFKSRQVENKWKTKLNGTISEIILKETIDAGLEDFLD